MIKYRVLHIPTGLYVDIPDSRVDKLDKILYYCCSHFSCRNIIICPKCPFSREGIKRVEEFLIDKIEEKR